MSYDYPIEIIENDVLVVSVQAVDGSYFMWQRGLTENVGSNDGIYFEVDDQVNGGHDNVEECSVDSDGMHVVLKDGKLVHFYFPPKFDKYSELKIGLMKIYEETQEVLEFHNI